MIMERDLESRLDRLASSDPHKNETALSSYTTSFILLTISFIFISTILVRVILVLSRKRPSSLSPRPKPSPQNPTHLLIVLGSGGHTAEMLNMLLRLPLLPHQYTHRTYVVSSGDSFSALKAAEFEKQVFGRGAKVEALSGRNYDIVTVRRARRVHQSIFTTPWSATLSLWDCLKVLRGTHPQQQLFGQRMCPDLILTNGPGTGVCVVVAALILLCLGINGSRGGSKAGYEKDAQYHGAGQMRSIFIESWARVKTLSLSGTILLPLVDRFLVQWPGLEGRGGKAEYVGALIA